MIRDLSGKPNEVVMEVITDPEILASANAQWEQAERNSEWLAAHAEKVYQAHRGRYICVAGQELFAADTVEEALAAAKAAHPEDRGVVRRFIPREGVERIYAIRG
jgi:hypothetical protein